MGKGVDTGARRDRTLEAERQTREKLDRLSLLFADIFAGRCGVALRRSLSVCRFFDATPHAEFLFDCVRRTIEKDLPNETDFLQRYDQFAKPLQAIADMPDRTTDLLFRFLHQNGGRLSRRAREREFEALTDEETERIERLYADIFGPPPFSMPSPTRS